MSSVVTSIKPVTIISTVEDLERNDGSQEKPYYMPKGLMKLLGKKNKKNKEESS